VKQRYGKIPYTRTGNVTKRKQVEQQLAEQARVLQQQTKLLELSSEAMFVRDERGAITYWNRGAEVMYGWRREEVIGLVPDTLLETQTPESIEIVNTLLQQESWQGELTRICKNGRQLIVESRQILIRDEEGQPAGFLEVNCDITNRKQAEITIREQERQLQQLSDSMPQFVWITDGDGELEYVNRQWRDYSGFTLEQSRDPSNMSQYHHPDDMQVIQEKWAIARKTKQKYEVEGRLKRASDGTYRWFLIRAVPILDDTGQVQRWYGTSTDIHDRKLAELNERFLNELDLRLRRLSDADAMLWETISSLGKYLNVDRCVWHEVNLPEDVSVVKQDWRRQEDIPSVAGVYKLSEFILPELVDCYHKAQPAVISDVANYCHTAPFRRNYAERDIRAFVGVPCIYEGRWVAVLAINARTVREWQPHEVALLQNTVSRLWSIVEQTRAAQALRESEERSRSALLNLNQELQRQLAESQTLLEVIPIGIGIAEDLLCQKIRVNSVFAQMLSIPPMVNASLSAPEDERPTNFKVYYEGQELSPEDLPLQRAAALGIEVRDLEIDVVWSDGTTLTLLEYAAPLFDEWGNVRGSIGAFLDITDRKRAEVALQELNITLEQRVEERTTELQEVNKDLEAFSYTVAHDLRAPLRGIQGFTQALAEDYGDRLDDTAREYIQHIFRGTEIMSELVHDLLAYSRLSREKIKLAPVHLAQVMADARAQLATDLHNCQADIAISENLPVVMGHYPILVQIIVNLLSNAIKFVAPGVQPYIRVWAETIEIKEMRKLCEDSSLSFPQIRLWIEDNGIGIEPSYQEQIFGVFERLHGTETYPGTGIGLAIVRKGAERLGGRAGVESTLGRGSRFWIELQVV
jgi:PAS domain S-box-containing protein